jgi:hypothetical protein
MPEANEDQGKDGERLGEDPVARPGTSDEQAKSMPHSEDPEDRGIEEFVEDMESDPARAGTDSPAQELMGG